MTPDRYITYRYPCHDELPTHDTTLQPQTTFLLLITAHFHHTSHFHERVCSCSFPCHYVPHNRRYHFDCLYLFLNLLSFFSLYFCLYYYYYYYYFYCYCLLYLVHATTGNSSCFLFLHISFLLLLLLSTSSLPCTMCKELFLTCQIIFDVLIVILTTLAFIRFCLWDLVGWVDSPARFVGIVCSPAMQYYEMRTSLVLCL